MKKAHLQGNNRASRGALATLATVTLSAIALGSTLAREHDSAALAAPLSCPRTVGASNGFGTKLAIRRLQQRVRVQARQLNSAYAASEGEAREKIIQELLLEDPHLADQLAPSPEEFGFCREKLSQSEYDTVVTAINQLRLPRRKLQLMLTTASESHEELTATTETAHQVIQSTLGDSRYRAVFSACEEQQNAAKTASDERTEAVLYRALGLTSGQISAIKPLATHLDNLLFGSSPNESTTTSSRLLDSTGTLPYLHETPAIPPPNSEEGRVEELKQEAITAEINELQAADRAKVRDILTEEQRRFLESHWTELSCPFLGLGVQLLLAPEEPQSPDEGGKK